MVSNNVTRLLDNRQVRYTAFTLPQEKLGAEETARLLDIPPGMVFKSIVVLRKGPGKPILAVVPGDQEVDLKKLARAVGEKKVGPATQDQAEEITHLTAGGISPLALVNRGFQILVHRSAQNLAQLHVSGGELGLNIRLSPRDLVELTGARLADIC